MGKKKFIFFMEIRLFLLATLYFLFTFVVQYLGNHNVKNTSSNLSVWIGKTQQKCGNLIGKEALDKCYRAILNGAVKEEGTENAVKVLELLRKKGVIDAKFDDHQHVHEIGRTTAQIKGLNIEAFLSCPSTYNYGCQHGFFEYALLQTNSYKEAAEAICENMPLDKPPKLYSYCYHGVGHGLMMALAYDLEQSLHVCDSFNKETAIEGCWQGTFMENTNLAVTEEEKVRWISKTDPLYPCNAMGEKYQWQCYINHAGYLMKRTNMNIQKAAEICLSAPKEGSRPCMQSIGLMTTNPIWQKSMRGFDTVLDPRKNVEIAWSMCEEMPEVARRDCAIGAVGNIHNFDEKNIDRSSLFCGLVDKQYQPDCYAQIGTALAGLVTNSKDASTICNRLSSGVPKDNCLWGTTIRLQTKNLSSAQTNISFSAKDTEKLITNDDFLKETVSRYGPKVVIKTLADAMPRKNLSCHDRAHETGRLTYKIYNHEAFRLCSSECHSGCYHGATEAFFHDKGTENLQENLEIVCQGQLNKFFKHQCIHGVGHGLMAWSNYELYDALAACDTLEGNDAQSSCWTGVFMENIVGGLSSSNDDGHFTKYVNGDPHYPCNAVDEKYKGSCYFLQTSRMMQLFNTDFEKIAKSCLFTPDKYRLSCFQSMGRDVGGTSKHDVKLAISKCRYAPYGLYRIVCLGGAAQDTFWDPKGKEEALLFCSLLSDEKERKRCYEIISQRAFEVLALNDFDIFCKRVPKDSNVDCSQYKTIASASENPPAQKSILSSKTNSSFSNTSTITITDNGYSPQKLTVKKGTKITFINKSSEARWPASNIHPTHKIFPEFDPKKPVKPDDRWEFVFDKEGVWYFHDHLLPTLTGTITVVK